MKARIQAVRHSGSPGKVEKRVKVSREARNEKQLTALQEEYQTYLRSSKTSAPLASAQHQQWEEWRLRQLADMAAVAEVRGADAARRQRSVRFLEETEKRAAAETRGAAVLVEKLRSAEMVARPAPARPVIVDVGLGGGRRVEIRDR